MKKKLNRCKKVSLDKGWNNNKHQQQYKKSKHRSKNNNCNISIKRTSSTVQSTPRKKIELYLPNEIELYLPKPICIPNNLTEICQMYA